MNEAKMTPKPPTVQDVKQILHNSHGKKTKIIRRFPTGLANYVFDVEAEDGDRLVVRLTRPDLKHFFDGALYWYKQLENKGVPIPKLYYYDVIGQHGFPTMIMDRLPGEDLGVAYPHLTSDQKRALAKRIVEVQKTVATLSKGKRYGYARSYDDPSLHERWVDVLDANLERSRKRIRKVGIIEETVVDKVRKLAHQHEDYFSSVEPTCFLDDITTKNVIVNNGELSGIVDIDSVAFGDPLLTVALTRMSLLSSSYDTEYTDYWTETLDLNKQQKKAINLYTAIFCVDFMSELGHTFNKDKATPVDRKKVEKLNRILDSLTSP